MVADIRGERSSSSTQPDSCAPMAGVGAQSPAARRPHDYGISTADAVPALISFFDTDHVCRFANDHHVQWYGRSPSELVGLHMRNFLGSEAYATRLPYLERVASGESVSFEAEVPHFSGRWRDAAIRYVPRMGPSGFEGFHTLVFDLSREQHRFHSVFDGTAVGFVEIDLTNVRSVITDLSARMPDPREHIARDLTVIRHVLDVTPVKGFNDKAVQMLRVKPASAMDKPLGRWFGSESLNVWNQVLLSYMSGGTSFEAETVLTREDGTDLDVLLSAAFPKRPEEQVLVVVGLVDISERVAKEYALAQAQLDLAHAARVATLGEMVASIAHEVNQPLAAIVANGNAAMRWLNRGEPDLAEAKAAILRMVGEGERASQIIARTRRMAVKGTGEQGPFDLNDMIGEASEITRRQVSSLGTSLTIHASPKSPTVRGDRIQLQQVVINLIVNAAQAMVDQPDGMRRVNVVTELENGLVSIEVADTGPGLDAEKAARVFDAFYTTKKDGMGMGLSVSKSIVEAHGGAIGVRRGSSGGSVFRIEIPAS